MAERVQRISDIPLYSSYLLPTSSAALAADSYKMFQTNLGATGQGFSSALTIAETNLRTAGQLPNEIGFLIEAIGIHIPRLFFLDTSSSAEDASRVPQWVDLLMFGGSIRFETPEYQEDLGLAGFFPPGLGIVNQAVAATFGTWTTNASGPAQSGSPNLTARANLQNPIELKKGTAFTFNYVVPTALTLTGCAQDIRLMTILFGRRTGLLNN